MASSSVPNESLEDQYAQLNLEEEEEGGVLITGDDDEDQLVFDDRWCLVGKFLTGRTIDFDAMRHMMASLWQSGKGVYIKELDTNRYIFQFYHEIDVQTVVDGSPWTFNRIPLVFHRLKKGDDPRSVHLHKLDMWVQIHDLRSGFMMDKVVDRAKQGVIGSIGSSGKNIQNLNAGIVYKEVIAGSGDMIMGETNMIIEDVWSSNSGSHVLDKIKFCSEALLIWGKTILAIFRKG
ncbi:hypothetical protein F8388_012493 [Cannabis sativa]|uniref:DUF4283 domain-containing protein n=1 Tax=Cannabis sativa TaxID=3483 RepID=A0A7J6GZZ5_CANSA|nr:hypothetical protein F8388_012493 [Cannabis sativa]